MVTATGLLMTVDASMVGCVMVDYTVERPAARPDFAGLVLFLTYWPEASLTHARDPAPVAHQCGPSAQSCPGAFSPLPGFPGIHLLLPYSVLCKCTCDGGLVKATMPSRYPSATETARCMYMNVRAASKRARRRTHRERGNKQRFKQILHRWWPERAESSTATRPCNHQHASRLAATRSCRAAAISQPSAITPRQYLGPLGACYSSTSASSRSGEALLPNGQTWPTWHASHRS